MRRHQLLAVLVFFGIDRGNGFVVVGGIGRQRRRRGSPITPPPDIGRVSSKKNANDGDEKPIKQSQKRRFASFFMDLWNSKKEEDQRRADNKKRKSSRSKAQQKLSVGEPEDNQSKGWLRRVFGDNKTDTSMSKHSQNQGQKATNNKPSPQLSGNKLGQSLTTTMSFPMPSSAKKAKRKKIDAQNQSPPSFNPFLYIQTAWKNTASSLFDGDSKHPKDEWITVFQTSGIMPGESVPITVKGIDLLVVASLDGRSLYCIANSCPHLGTPLETGQLTRLPIEESSVASSYGKLVSEDADTTTTDLFGSPQNSKGLILSETQVSEILSQDGCEDCIVCPLHRTAFALRSGEVRGDWCPHPPVLGPALGTIKPPTAAITYEIRTRGKNVQVKLIS